MADINGRPAWESVWKRAVFDTREHLKRPLFVVVQLATGAIAGAISLAIPGVPQFAIPIIALAAAVVPFFLIKLSWAPFAQRNEARGEVKRLWERLKPKLTIFEPVRYTLDVGPHPDGGPRLLESVRLDVRNETDATVKKCKGTLLELHSYIEWLPHIDKGGDRIVQDGDAFTSAPRPPLPIPLRWSANEEATIDIDPQGSALLDVCFYDYANKQIDLAFHSKELTAKHHFPAGAVVLLLRIDSADCLPIHCVFRYETHVRADNKGYKLDWYSTWGQTVPT